MKHFYAFCLLFLTKIVFAQDTLPYLPMIVEGHWWQITCFNCLPPDPWGAPTYISEYDFLKGDSIVNGKIYKKLYHCSMGIGDYTRLTALMREDSMERRVYAIYFNGFGGYLDFDVQNYSCVENEEILLYDFSLQAGDTANFCWYNATTSGVDNAIVNSTIYTNNNPFISIPAYRKHIHIHCAILIEGWGSFSSGPFPSASHCWGTYSFGVTKMLDGWLNCESVLDMKDALMSQINIYPNPSNDILYIQSNPAIKTNYRIISVLGIEYLHGEVSHEAINTERLPQGIYLIEIKRTNNVPTIYKMVKE